MADTTNYNQTNITGESWQRAHHIVIENPLGELPKLTFGEQKVFIIGDKTISEFVGQNLVTTFDPTNEKHLALYTALNELYTELRDLRDSSPAISPGHSPIGY